MGVYTAKAAGFALCVYAKKSGYCHKAMMRFKFAEMAALLGFEAVASYIISVAVI